MANEIDYLGAEGGRLAMAFGSGAGAAWTFSVLVGATIWRLVEKVRQNRIAELEKSLALETERCREMESRLTNRIMVLESILLQHGGGPLRQAMQAAISELRIQQDQDGLIGHDANDL